jgi:integrase
MSQKRVTLTAAFLAALSPPVAGRRDIADAGSKGLVYRITAAGARSWTLRYRMPGSGRLGVPARYTIGDAANLPLGEARRIADRLRTDIAKGIDPSAARRQALADERARPTVAEAAPRWLATKSPIPGMKKRSKSGYENAATTMRKYVVPALGAMKVGDVERRHVAALHEKMKATPIAANRMLACVSTFMNWCAIEGARPPHSNPVYGIARYPETRRMRFLNVDELARLGAALARAEAEGLPPSEAMRRKGGGMSRRKRAALGTRPKRGPYKQPAADVPEVGGKGAKGAKPADRYAVGAIRLMLFTGWRMAEVVATRWADVDLTNRVVTHPTTKGGATSRPLSAPAAALLADLPRLATDTPWVFPRAGDPSKPIGKPVRLWDAVRHAAGLHSADKATRVMSHDLRHTVGAIAASSGASLPVIAALLGHKQVRTTERYAHLSRDARHEAADAVGALLSTALSPGTTTTPVTPIDRAKRA